MHRHAYTDRRKTIAASFVIAVSHVNIEYNE